MDAVRIDFETRSQGDLKLLGARLYSLHPTTEVLCYASQINDGPVWGAFVEETLADFDLEVVQAYQFHTLQHALFEGHNVGFELAIWENIMCPRYDWPQPNPMNFYCSAAKAAAHGLPRDLEGAAQAMHLPIEKDKKGKALMLKLSKPRPHWKKTGKGNIYFGTREEFEQLLEYCKQDVRTEYALSKKLRPLLPFERKTFLLDLKINRRGIHCDKALIKKAIGLSAIAARKGNEKIDKLTNGAVKTTGQTEKIRHYLWEHCGFAMHNMRAETVEAALNTALPCDVEAILTCRQQNSKSSVKKYLAMLNRASGVDNRIREILLFCGAHTGRWSGIKIQPHNYPRPKLSRLEIEHLLIPAIMDERTDLLELYRGSVGAALSDTLRSALTAAPDHDLIGADYSSIEARVLSWIAKEEFALQLFHDDEDVYVDMASKIYRIPAEQILEGYENEDLTATRQRKVGKETVLGCGYQMGAPRFDSECKKKGIDLPEGMADFIIRTYRNEYKRVKALWYDVHRTALRALSGPATTTVGLPIKMGRRDSFLCIQLPSGRMLTYADPEIRMNRFGNRSISYKHVDPETKKWVRTTGYGGHLVENIVQATARDIMAYAMHLVENAGYWLVATVHDEIISEVLKGFGTVKEFERLLCTLPAWAYGCPIAAKGWRGERYRK